VAKQDLPNTVKVDDDRLGEGGQQVSVFASNLGGSVRSYALCRMGYIDGTVIVASLVISCNNLTIGVAPDEADPLI
jgi:hypothetical protein